MKTYYFIHNYIIIIGCLMTSFRNESKMSSDKSGVHWLDQVVESEWCMSVECGSRNLGGHPMTVLVTIAEEDHEIEKDGWE